MVQDQRKGRKKNRALQNLRIFTEKEERKKRNNY